MAATRTAVLFASSLAVLSLGACAGVQQTAGLRPSQPTPSLATADDDSSAYGLFLAGTAASNAGRNDEAVDFFTRAATHNVDADFLNERAFRAAVASGDIHRAAELAPTLGASSVALQQFARLACIVDAIADGQGREAQTLLAAGPLPPPHGAAGLLLAPWAAAQVGDWKTATVLPDAHGDRLVTGLAQLDQALILERAHRDDAADTAFRLLLADGNGGGVYTAAYGGFLERRGRKAVAVTLYDSALKADPGNRLIQLARARAQTTAPPPPAPTIAQGAAEALLAPAADFLAGKETDMGLAYLELVLRLDPNRGEAWVLVGETRALMGDIDGARAAYARPLPGTPEYLDARAQLIATYDQPQDAPIVLQLAQEAMAALPGDQDAETLLADALRINNRYAESAKVLDDLIAAQGATASWQLYYMRGVALDQSGDWTGAQRDLNKALSLDPDEPEVLNYLGYSLVDRGEQLPAAKVMIEKAIAGKPDSGALVDSLGWAYYRMGQYGKAVEQLEHAAELEPADADINNHLGDAYWRVGRRIEARFQWERVLTLDPDAKLKDQVQTKLKSGLDPQPQPAKDIPVASR
jgi:tetratricopeptide (TPR) repeat protein